VVGIIFAILGLIAALLYIPIGIRLEVASDLYTGRMQVSCRYLCFQIRLHYRLDIFERPYLTLSRINGSGSLYPVKRQGKKKQWLAHQQVLNLIRRSKLRKLAISIRLGIPGDAAGTALFCGGLREALQKGLLLALPESSKAVFVQVQPDFDRGIFQGDLQCMFFVKPVKIVLEIIRIRIRNRVKRKVKTIVPSH